jgi:hypothetical protein
MIAEALWRWLRLKRSEQRGRASHKRKHRHAFRPQLDVLEERAVPAAISALQLRAAYGIDQIRFGAGVVGNGAGQTIALVVIGSDDLSLVSDLQSFDRSLFGQAGAQVLDTFGSYDQPHPGSSQPWFAAVIDTTDVPGGYTQGQINKHNLETAEDVEWAHVVAPMANILLIETKSIQSGTGYAGTLQMLNPNWGISVIASSSSHFQFFNSQDYTDTNVAYVGITGDTGTSIYSQLEGFGPHDFPASTPDVIAVGGTTLSLNPDGSYRSETGWGFAGPNRFLTSDNVSLPTAFWAPTPGGFSGTYYTQPGGPIATLATWSTTVTSTDVLGINDKGLEVSATWVPNPINANNVQYVVNHYDSVGNLLRSLTVTVNQQLAPNGTVGTLNSRTATFQELCAFSNVAAGDQITVSLESLDANRPVVADAIGLGPDDAGGGGLSDQPQPSFQAGLVIHNGNSIISSGGARAYPDVAFDGDYINSPVLIVNQGQTQGVAGTSLGASAWAGLIAIADQGLATVGHAPLSTAQALAGLYSLASWDFHDETSGYNGYSAGPGYDLVTGLGSPIANQLILDLDNTVTPVSGPLTYEAPEGQGPNNLQVIQNGATIEILNNSSVVAAAPVARTTAIDIIGAQHGFNTLTLNFPAAPQMPMSFDGGSPGGTLVINGSFTREVDFASDAHSGTLYLDGLPIAYTGLATMIDTSPATTLTIFDPVALDQVTIGNDPNSPENGVPTSQISGSGFAKVDFANKSNVVFIDSTKLGNDTITILNPLVNNATFIVEQVPSITNGPATPIATVGTAYSFSYTTQGAPVPTFRLLPGSTLPPGLSLSPSGVISGTPTAAGTYTGTVDAANGAGIDATQNYSITVGKARPRISATAGPSVIIGTSQKMTASAQLTGGFNETGILAFGLFAPNGTLVDTEAVAVNGDGIYSTPQGYLPHVAGTYQWVAVYRGDANNSSVSTVRGSTPEVAISLVLPHFRTLLSTPGVAAFVSAAGSSAIVTAAATSPAAMRVLLSSGTADRVTIQSHADDNAPVGDSKNDSVALGGDVFDLTTSRRS